MILVNMMKPSDILHAQGLKSTPARQHILQLLLASSRPMTLEDIAHHSTQVCDLATIYRTIPTLLAAGIMKKVFTGKNVLSYELVSHHHHHIVCTACEAVEHVDTCAVDGLTKRILASSTLFSHITDHSFELFGVCRNCAIKNTSAPTC